jgi:uncharacterized protein DUF6011
MSTATATLDHLFPAPQPCPKCNGTGQFISYSGRVVGGCFACKGTKYAAQPRRQASIDVAKLQATFDKAQSNGVKRPVIRLVGFKLSLAPPNGRNPGAIYVKKDELYLGKILDAAFAPSRDCTPEDTAALVEAAADPEAALRAYGFKTGECGICGRELTNGESIKRGIGPICAEKFGL